VSPLVLDAMSWALADEQDAEASHVLDLLKESGAIVPPIWPIEVVNALFAAERWRRLTQDESSRFLELLRQLRITITPIPEEQAPDLLLVLARQYQLTAYDVCYLALCVRTGLPALASRDRSLRAAAKRLSIALVPD
jgi:predicted nucleic acid-binding protein